MFTVLTDSLDEILGFTCGADAYLAKPCEPTEVLRTVDQPLRGAYDTAAGCRA